MDRAEPLKITCTYCGHHLATRLTRVVIYRGLELPLEGLDGIIFKCVCKRTKAFYFKHLAEPATPPRKTL